jgi:WD40 repeat protein
VKFCEFSPKNGVAGYGDILLTGSNDGVINLWNMNVGQWRSTKENTFDLEDKARLLLTIDDAHGCRKTTEIKVSDPSGHEQTEIILEDIQQIGIDFKENSAFTKSICDCVRWSCNGRFAIASVQCRVESENSDFCRIKIWDNVENSFVEDLSRLSGIRLPKNTFVLATHPVHEEILVSGSDTGILALWNLYTK